MATGVLVRRGGEVRRLECGLYMLAWALWIAAALLRWLHWGWESFGAGGYWRALRPPKPAST